MSRERSGKVAVNLRIRPELLDEVKAAAAIHGLSINEELTHRIVKGQLFVSPLVAMSDEDRRIASQSPN